jgi:hypothetical protein
MDWHKLDQAELRATLSAVKDDTDKVPVIERPDWTIFMEKRGGHTFLHCEVHKPWTAQRARQLAKDTEQLLEANGGPAFVLCDPGNTKLKKFLTQFRFQYVSNVPRSDEQGFIEVFVRL